MSSLANLLVLLTLLGCSFGAHAGHVDYPGGLQSGCLQGEKHKDTPSPETDLGICKDYSESSCCSAGTAGQLSATPITTVDDFRWDNCGTLSKRCQDFMVHVECFYRCSPSLPTWAAPFPSAIRGVPVCMQFCDDWMEACREDLTCAENWITGWKLEDGGFNKCRADERCRSFAEVFRNGRGLCESIWGQSFMYESSPDTPCLDFRFSPTEGQVTLPDPGKENVEPPFKRQDECVVDVIGKHKKKPSPEPELSACRNYRQDSCCTTEIDSHMVHRPIKKVGKLNWDTCGHLSPRCEEFLMDSQCFYQCSPLVNNWRDPDADPLVDPFTPVVEGIPVCSQFCDDMFNACKFDRTCAVNWARDWDFSTGENRCKSDSKCELIKDVYKNGKGLCEQVWGRAFKYVPNDACLDPRLHPNEQITKPQKGVVAAVETEEDWGCMQGGNHKIAPGPEPGLQVCSAYTMNSCCSEEFDRQLRGSPVMKVDTMYVNRCGTKSPRCEQFHLALECYYRCDPKAYQYSKRGHTRDVQNVPLCSSYCDDFFDACRDDLTCAENYATDWYFTSEGINNCRPDSKCRTFAEVYTDGRGLCETLWGDSYLYSEDEDTCISINTVGARTRPSTEEDHHHDDGHRHTDHHHDDGHIHTDNHHDDGHRHMDMSQTDSHSWACTRHDHPHHKEYPTPEPGLQVCTTYAYGSCCNVELDRHLVVRPITGVDHFSWNRCGTPSPQCENFLIDLECFNRCSPDISRLSVSTDTGSTIPVCSSFCDRWFDACRNDLTCVANWRSDWEMDDMGWNTCPEGSSCMTFNRMYGDSQTMCETFFGNEFQYNSTDMCVDIPLHSTPVHDHAIHHMDDPGAVDTHGHGVHHQGHGHEAHHVGHESTDHGDHTHESHHSSGDGHTHESHHPGHSAATHGDHEHDDHHIEDGADHGHEVHHGGHSHGAHPDDEGFSHSHMSHHEGSGNEIRSVQPLSWPVHQCTWHDGLKDRDGLVKECSFHKKHYSSVLRLAFTGGLSIENCTECCKRWYFTINGIECQQPGDIDAVVMKKEKDGNMLYQHQHFEGFCDKVGTGQLDVELRVQDCAEHMPHHGHSGAMDPGDAQTGGHCCSRIIVEEIKMTP